jgi:hypothetical protein
VLLEHAVHTDAPVGAGIVDALDSVRAARTATSFEAGQPPGVRILLATRREGVTRVQVALLGATQAVRQLAIRLDGRVIARVRAGRRVQTVAWRGRAGRRVTVTALAAGGRKLASASARVRALRMR